MNATAARLSLLLALGACAAEDKPAESTGDGGTELPADAPWYCAEGSYAVTDGRVETEHYALSFALDPDEAVQMARMAEAAYAAMGDYFQAEPTALPLEAGWYADFESFRAAIEADGTSAPEAGGYYWPGTNTAYMYSQPNTYFSRMLFIHELVHQFHFLARTGNQSRDSWYVEGVAEYLSRHDWDGDCLRLGRLPTLTWEDAPAQALAEGTLAFTGSGDLSRPWAWATYRYLQQEEPAAFDAFRAAYDADPSTILADHVDVEQTVSSVQSWLPGQQEPMTPVFYDWIHITDGVVHGESPYFSMALAKQSERFTVSHDAPVGSAGVVAGYDDSSNYSAWLVAPDGGVWTFVSIAGSATWWSMGAVEPAERYTWTVEGTVVGLNGVDFEEGNGFAPRAGIAVNADSLWMEGIGF